MNHQYQYTKVQPLSSMSHKYHAADYVPVQPTPEAPVAPAPEQIAPFAGKVATEQLAPVA